MLTPSTLWRICLLAALTTVASAQATLVVESVPTGARVEVDGSFVGTTPVGVDVEPGERSVTVARMGYAVWEETAEMTAGETVRMEATLVRPGGTIIVQGAPEGSTIFVDGVPVDGPVAARAGGVAVRIERPGERPVQVGAPVVGGAETVLTYVPAQLNVPLTLAALSVPGSAQLLDGRAKVGAPILGVFLISTGVAVFAELDARDLEELYEIELEVYNDAGSEGQVNASLARLDDLIEQSNQARTTQRGAIAVGSVAYLLGTVDALRNHLFPPSLDISEPRFPTVSFHRSGVRLSFPL